MTEEMNESWVQPYTNEIDGQFQLGFDLAKCWTVDIKKKGKFDVEAQMSWLATVFAERFLKFALAKPEDREQIIEHQKADSGTEQVSESQPSSS